MLKRRVVLGAVAGFLAPGGFPVRVRAASEKVRIAAPALDSTALIFYAEEMGFFKQAGLDVELSQMANGEAVTVAVTGGAIDIGCSQAVSVIVAYKKGLPVTIVAPAGQQAQSNAVGQLFVPLDSPAQSGKDFDGKTLGVVGIRGLAQYGAQAWLDKTGGNSSTVKFIELSGAQLAVALADKRIDGAFVPEPFVTPVRKVARAIANPMEAIAPNFMSAAHFAMAPWTKEHSAEVRTFQQVIHETAVWANRNRERTSQMLVKLAKINPDTINNAVRSLYSERLDPAQLQPLIDVAVKYGGLAPFSASEMIFR